MGKQRFRISYIRKPFAKRSRYCLGTALASFVMCGVSLGLSVHLQGQGELNVAAWGVSSFLFALMAMAYGGLSFLEKEKNYILSKIGMWMAGGLLVVWVYQDKRSRPRHEFAVL